MSTNQKMHVYISDLVEFIKGKEWDPEYGTLVVLHSCNCFCTQRAGVALDLTNEWSVIRDVDNATIPGDKRKLGHWSMANLKVDDEAVLVHNLYAQYRYGPAKQKHFDIEAFRLCCQNLRRYYHNQKVQFAFPLIGSGYGGGNWQEISDVIVEELGDFRLNLIRPIGQRI